MSAESEGESAASHDLTHVHGVHSVPGRGLRVSTTWVCALWRAFGIFVYDPAVCLDRWTPEAFKSLSGPPSDHVLACHRHFWHLEHLFYVRLATLGSKVSGLIWVFSLHIQFKV